MGCAAGTGAGSEGGLSSFGLDARLTITTRGLDAGLAAGIRGPDGGFGSAEPALATLRTDGGLASFAAVGRGGRFFCANFARGTVRSSSIVSETSAAFGAPLPRASTVSPINALAYRARASRAASNWLSPLIRCDERRGRPTLAPPRSAPRCVERRRASALHRICRVASARDRQAFSEGDPVLRGRTWEYVCLLRSNLSR